jgi:hypothetical protein
VTPDGRSLLFAASDGAGIAPGYQHGECGTNENVSGNGLCSELYVYRADSSTPGRPGIVCASCNLDSPGAHGVQDGVHGDTYTNTRVGAGTTSTNAYLNRSLSNDGRYVFFDTTEPLVPEDTNGVFDAYSYDVRSGENHLLSSGTDPAPSYFLDASADGSDAFIATRQQLSGWDDDQAYDLYDVRAGGGFPEPPPAPICSGDSCHAPPAAQPPLTSPGSSSLEDEGNRPEIRKHCPRGTRKVRRKGHTRCVKPHRHHKRTANHNRRAGR